MSKAKRIQALLKSGKSIKEVAKATKSSEAYVYYVRWTEAKRNEPTSKKVKKKAVYKSPRSRLLQDIFQAKRDVEAVKTEPLRIDSSGYPHFGIGTVVSGIDPINHPPHYKAGGIETLDFIEAKDLNYRLGNVVKYISRAGKKINSDPVVDLEKALFYLKREIDVRKGA